MATISVLNGPNLNLLGIREPGHYGNKTLADIRQLMEKKAAELNHKLDFHQNNAEHQIIELIHRAYETGVDFIIINPAAFTHSRRRYLWIRSYRIRTGLTSRTSDINRETISNGY
jgi:3-dehydroquinate dehydratase-2